MFVCTYIFVYLCYIYINVYIYIYIYYNEYMYYIDIIYKHFFRWKMSKKSRNLLIILLYKINQRSNLRETGITY